MNSLEESRHDIISLKNNLLPIISQKMDIATTNAATTLFNTLETIDFTNVDGDLSLINTLLAGYILVLREFARYPDRSDLRINLKEKTITLLESLEKIVLPNEAKVEIINLDSIGDLLNQFRMLNQAVDTKLVSVSDNMRDYNSKISSIEEKLKPIESLTSEAQKALSLSKQTLETIQKASTIQYTERMHSEYRKVGAKYMMTGVYWLLFSALSLGVFLWVVLMHQVDYIPLDKELISDFGIGFVSSLYALSPIFIKFSLLIVSMICFIFGLRMFAEYKRMTQEYRHKALLAKNLLSGIDVLKPYIGDHVINGFVLPSLEKLLEDPINKVYLNCNANNEETLSIVQKMMEIGNNSKEFVTNNK